MTSTVYGQQLVNELRKNADKVSDHLWISVPYIGGPDSVRRILGRQWIEKPSVTFRLLTDTNEVNHFNAETLRLFHDRGKIKHIAGLHAKIFVLDDTCLITSANLTNKAFTKRHEIGIFLKGKDAYSTVKIFEDWWKKAEDVSVDTLNKLIKRKGNSIEEKGGINLKAHWTLPNDPGRPSIHLERRFLNYDTLLVHYRHFATQYSSIQRIWKRVPLYFETDNFLNYLYHHATGTPSNMFKDQEARSLTPFQQLAELKRYAKRFNRDREQHPIGHYHNSSTIIKRYLRPGNVFTITKSNIREILDQINALNSYPWNKDPILDENSLPKLRRCLNILVNSNERLAVRMTECNTLYGVGRSTMNEILGYTYPNRYPLINKNSNSGLRFFGYPIRVSS